MVKKNVILKCSVAERRAMVTKDGKFSIQEQCELLRIHRSGSYYISQGDSAVNIKIMFNRRLFPGVGTRWSSYDLRLFMPDRGL